MRLGLGAVLGLFSFLAIAQVSCADDSPTTTTSDAGADGSALSPEATAFLSTLCGLYGPCCTNGSDTCATATEELARGLELDPARASACLDSLRTAAKDPSFCIHPPADGACAAVFKSKKAKEPGGTCKQSSDCASGEDGEGICVLQKCRRATRGKEGDACIGTRIDGKIESVFGLAVDAGAVCSAAFGLYCSEETKKCQTRGQVGTACSGTDVSCVDDAWCPTTSKECAPRTAGGASCEDEYECGLGFRCANDGAGGGACTALAGSDASCERGDECNARQGLVCDTETAKCTADISLSERACTGMLALVQ